ncbi:hypothetical protein WNZ14_17060 [Hoeflea sp. AS60]|uniref:hypothetical protein n=1 Tax=Hoeflea sp. AS60 TaxID=3135780 RepID=UPI0031797E47
MTENVHAAPKFEAVVSGEARPENRSVALLFGTADGEKYSLEFDARIVPATITALASLLGQVVSDLPEDDQPNFQVLKTTGMGLAMNPQGRLGLTLALEGGGEMTLELAKADLPVLREQIDEAISISEEPRH